MLRLDELVENLNLAVQQKCPDKINDALKHIKEEQIEHLEKGIVHSYLDSLDNITVELESSSLSKSFLATINEIKGIAASLPFSTTSGRKIRTDYHLDLEKITDVLRAISYHQGRIVNPSAHSFNLLARIAQRNIMKKILPSNNEEFRKTQEFYGLELSDYLKTGLLFDLETAKGIEAVSHNKKQQSYFRTMNHKVSFAGLSASIMYTANKYGYFLRKADTHDETITHCILEQEKIINAIQANRDTFDREFGYASKGLFLVNLLSMLNPIIKISTVEETQKSMMSLREKTQKEFIEIYNKLPASYRNSSYFLNTLAFVKEQSL